MAEIQDIMAENDFTASFKSVNTLPNNPSRIQIENVLNDNGISTPLIKSVNFYLRDVNSKGFFVIYSQEEDEFYFERLTKAA